MTIRRILLALSFTGTLAAQTLIQISDPQFVGWASRSASAFANAAVVAGALSGAFSGAAVTDMTAGEWLGLHVIGTSRVGSAQGASLLMRAFDDRPGRELSMY